MRSTSLSWQSVANYQKNLLPAGPHRRHYPVRPPFRPRIIQANHRPNRSRQPPDQRDLQYQTNNPLENFASK
jgi:hypothetical protein